MHIALVFCLLFLCSCHVKINTASLITQEVELPPGQECIMTPVVHVLRHPGCEEQYIPSFACVGKCSSYLQVAMNASCMKKRTYCVRCRAVKFGKWNEHVTVAKSLEKEKPQLIYTAQELREKRTDTGRSSRKRRWNVCAVLVVLLTLILLFHKKQLVMPKKDRFIIISGKAFRQKN